MKLADYRKIASAVAADLEAALLKYGLKMKPFGAKIDERCGTVRMAIECLDVNHTGATVEQEIYKANCRLLDCSPEWLGQTFSMNRWQFKLTGMKKRGDKCMIIERLSDKTIYTTTAESVRRAFADQAPVRKAG